MKHDPSRDPTALAVGGRRTFPGMDSAKDSGRPF